jgi:very-short-patch-repair endonuclease
LGHAPDAGRSCRIEASGYRILRFWNNDVLRTHDGILTDIQKALSPDPNSQDERNRSSATADLAKSAIDA